MTAINFNCMLRRGDSIIGNWIHVACSPPRFGRITKVSDRFIFYRYIEIRAYRPVYVGNGRVDVSSCDKVTISKFDYSDVISLLSDESIYRQPQSRKGGESL